ncbi:type 2A phosphatase activator TIP41 [Gaeumannomyces tritici R3-111a-1]|uniref:Type 2A phosphatase activator TIP41 n=1 Tax=Gaeumannomyces tritici (strain R3-111a-1) TaxID=644352 RepID=J3NJG4_GAET3|nr:type 2A phosphatase activator TIP41 [Gaeumannomyces tritici R3-111a-1]EJT81416.1 type 2A phosphatase activator TIP41 [Gaeumannomyces tritici R3-111a-1]
MALHVTSTREPFPTPSLLGQATRTHRTAAAQGGGGQLQLFEVSSRKLPISKSGAIDDMCERVGVPIPEMIFGDNLVSVRHPASGWALEFAAEAALDRVEKTDRGMLRVAHAGEWSSSRELGAASAAGIRQVVKPFDWSYSSDYRGSETAGGSGGDGGEEQQKKRLGGGSSSGSSEPLKPIPLELLKRRDPILFFDEVVLYESELDDNGISLYSVKVRVMEHRMLLLARLYMRLDGVLVRVRDTRVYVDFDTGDVIREYTAKEDKFENVKRNLMMKGMLPDAITTALRDSNQVAELLPVVEHDLENLNLA